MADRQASDTVRPDGLSPFWKSLAGPPREKRESESPEQILKRLGLAHFERVPKAAHWRELISRNARTAEEIAVEVAKLIRILLLGLTRSEWDTLAGISEAERNEPAMAQKHDAMKARLARFVERWDPVPPAQMGERFEEVQRRIDAYLEKARDACSDPSLPPP
ncbi:hypothetical protein [Roseateles sp. LKC17W]|uniref:Uncharacterized protein n=1 Tax=Pelomonas margarita TaxID=3299031 RepID=A0ABW7FJH4_9BURK